MSNIANVISYEMMYEMFVHGGVSYFNFNHLVSVAAGKLYFPDGTFKQGLRSASVDL